MFVSKVFHSVIIGAATLVVLLFAFGCHSTQSTAQHEVHPQVPVVQVLYMPEDSLNVAYKGLVWNTIKNFYKGRQQRLFWADPSFSGMADTLTRFIENIRYYGLLPGRYHLGELEATKGQSTDNENVFRREALLTDAFLLIVKDLQLGQLAGRTAVTDSVSLALLNKVAQHGGVAKWITSTEPVSREYRLMKNALKALLDTLPQRAALISEGLLMSSVTAQIRTLEINIERLRARGAIQDKLYILVNIPSFMLQVISNDSVMFESKVIVGKPENPTPELSSTIECMVTYPYWHVPRKIAVEEYLPLIQEDTSFIDRNNFDVLDRKGKLLDPDSINWGKYSRNYFPVSLRQREGTENSLGVVKFVFDNPYAVFLHDTNAKRLFRSNMRAFSHGCIRIEKATELAHYLLTGSLTARSKSLDRYLKQESRHTMSLTTPIPIHIRYFTCDVGDNQFRVYRDIYELDEILRSRLDATAYEEGL